MDWKNRKENIQKKDEKDYLWENIKDLPYFRAVLRAVEARFYQDIALSQPVLDLGCGDGHFASKTFEEKIRFSIRYALKKWGETN